MSNAFERAFWLAVDDINAGRIEAPERYLQLVPSTQRDELAQLLATVIASRGPVSDGIDPADYVSTLAAIDEVVGAKGPTGMLPAALKRMRKTRGIERKHVIDALAAEYGVTSPAGRKALERFYHRLESGVLVGPRIAHRLLASLAREFEADPREFVAAVRPTGSAARASAVPAMGRGAGDAGTRTSGSRDQLLLPDPDEQLVERLFTGGPDA